MARFSATTINKGESMALSEIPCEKDNKDFLENVHIGLGWDLIGGRRGVDLDAFAVQMDQNDNLIEKIQFGHLRSRDGAIIHSGDNTTGEGDGDDEIITINFKKLNPKTHKIAIGVNIYSGSSSFDNIENAFFRLANAKTKEHLLHYDLSNEYRGARTMHMCTFVLNESGEWEVQAVGQGTSHPSISSFVDSITTSKSATRIQSVEPTQSVEQKKGFFGKLFGR